MQKGCACSFLYGTETEEDKIKQIEDSLNNKTELKLEIVLSRKDGKFLIRRLGNAKYEYRYNRAIPSSVRLAMRTN